MSDEKRFKQSMRKLAARLVELQDRAHLAFSPEIVNYRNARIVD